MNIAETMERTLQGGTTARRQIANRPIPLTRKYYEFMEPMIAALHTGTPKATAGEVSPIRGKEIMVME